MQSIGTLVGIAAGIAVGDALPVSKTPNFHNAITPETTTVVATGIPITIDFFKQLHLVFCCVDLYKSVLSVTLIEDTASLTSPFSCGETPVRLCAVNDTSKSCTSFSADTQTWIKITKIHVNKHNLAILFMMFPLNNLYLARKLSLILASAVLNAQYLMRQIS